MKLFDARFLYGTKFMEKDEDVTLEEKFRQTQAERGIVIMNEQTYMPIQESMEIADKRLSECENVYGVIPMISSCTGEVQDIEKTIKTMKQKGYIGFLLSPESFRIPQRPVFLADELDACERLNIPVYYHADTFEYIADVLESFPKLTLILSFRGVWPNTRMTYPLLKAYKNVNLCIAENVWMNGIESLCEAFGSQRLLYSSSYPTLPGGIGMLMVANADITDEDKENISYKNMERIIGSMNCD